MAGMTRWFGGALAIAAVAEALADQPLVLLALALATTVPPIFLGPAPAAVTVSAASVLSVAVFAHLTVAGALAVLLALGRYRRVPAAVLAVAYLVLALAGAHPHVLVVLLAGLAPAAAWSGIAYRAHTEAQAHHAAREEAAGTLVEHTARGERVRIARELHDVVAHHISMIAVQAETARLTTPGLPAAGAQRLTEIGDSARAGLTEMRRLLGVLRDDTRTVPATRHPQPGLEQLNELLDEARDASGTGTRLIVSGSPTALDPGVELAAYRIVQEALTNARRHARGAAVDVELTFTGDALRVRIRDNGPGFAGAGEGAGEEAGHGLPGMRERALAVGGELRVGPATPTGFLVEAVLPAKVSQMITS
jgi:signal transduction histidine kinase